jgi:hypothetical protein
MALALILFTRATTTTASTSLSSTSSLKRHIAVAAVASLYLAASVVVAVPLTAPPLPTPTTTEELAKMLDAPDEQRLLSVPLSLSYMSVGVRRDDPVDAVAARRYMRAEYVQDARRRGADMATAQAAAAAATAPSEPLQVDIALDMWVKLLEPCARDDGGQHCSLVHRHKGTQFVTPTIMLTLSQHLYLQVSFGKHANPQGMQTSFVMPVGVWVHIELWTNTKEVRVCMYAPVITTTTTTPSTAPTNSALPLPPSSPPSSPTSLSSQPPVSDYRRQCTSITMKQRVMYDHGLRK